MAICSLNPPGNRAIDSEKPHNPWHRRDHTHFNYVLLPKDQPVPSFRLPLSDEEQTALPAVADTWSHPRRDPKPQLPGQQTISKTVTSHPAKRRCSATCTPWG